MNKLQEANLKTNLHSVSVNNPNTVIHALVKGNMAQCIRESNAALIAARLNDGYKILFSMKNGNLI